MKCREIQRRLSRWTDGQSPQGEIARLEAHISACSECRKAHAEQKILAGLLRDGLGTGGIEPSPGFDAALYRRLEPLKPRMRLFAWQEWLLPFPGWSMSRAMAFAVLALMIGSAGGVYSGLREAQETEAGMESPAAHYLSYSHESLKALISETPR